MYTVIVDIFILFHFKSKRIIQIPYFTERVVHGRLSIIFWCLGLKISCVPEEYVLWQLWPAVIKICSFPELFAVHTSHLWILYRSSVGTDRTPRRYKLLWVIAVQLINNRLPRHIRIRQAREYLNVKTNMTLRKKIKTCPQGYGDIIRGAHLFFIKGVGSESSVESLASKEALSGMPGLWLDYAADQDDLSFCWSALIKRVSWDAAHVMSALTLLNQHIPMFIWHMNCYRCSRILLKNTNKGSTIILLIKIVPVIATFFHVGV